MNFVCMKSVFNAVFLENTPKITKKTLEIATIHLANRELQILWTAQPILNIQYKDLHQEKLEFAQISFVAKSTS